MENSGPLDFDVKYMYSISEVEFSSRLNTAFKEALQNLAAKEELLKPIQRDYQENQRQFALYLVDCDHLKCSDAMR